MPKLKVSPKAYEKTLRDLEKNGRAGFGKLAEGVSIAIGAASAAFAAPTIAAAAGYTSIPVISYLASLVGIVALGSTPPGWIAGCAVAGGAISYGIGKLIRFGGQHDEKRRVFRENVIEKVKKYKDSSYQISDDEQFKNVIHILHIAYYQKSISAENGIKIIAALKTDYITPAQALDICEDLVLGKINNLKIEK